jgi:hypothetical protein
VALKDINNFGILLFQVQKLVKNVSAEGYGKYRSNASPIYQIILR